MTTHSIVNYAENGALHYAQHIIKNTSFKKIFAFGCSGDEKHHKIRPIFVNENNYKILDEIENFENFSKKNIDKFYKEVILEETPSEIIELKQIYELSKKLNTDLYKYGNIRDSQRPLVISAILLALAENINITESLDGDTVNTDGNKIYNHLSYHLERVDVGNKKEDIKDQFNFIKNNTNLNDYNEKLGKTPLKYFTEFIKEKIYSQFSKSPEDMLGFFYEEFVKYSGGDGQTLGIILTPKHIRELFYDLLDIIPIDKVLDPCAGTGGFLITAMEKMLKAVNTEEEKTQIKKNNIHGIEIKEDMFTIASTSMIFRGDGKSNLILGDFFKKDPKELQKKNFTVGMMNPPYAQGNKDTPELYEINFIKHLLDSLNIKGRCAVIVPQSTMVGKTKFEKNIKKEILKKHTLEGVITLNNDTTFYKIGVNPCIAVFTAHKPHEPEQRVKFINFKDDGYKLAPHIGIIETPRASERKKYLLNCWKYGKEAPTSFMVESQVKASDDWLHSFYYFNDEIPNENSFIDTMQEYLSFEFDMISKNKEYLFNE